jgi:hypothetical protein
MGVKQDYLPVELMGKTFLEDNDSATELDPDVEVADVGG